MSYRLRCWSQAPAAVLRNDDETVMKSMILIPGIITPPSQELPLLTANQIIEILEDDSEERKMSNPAVDLIPDAPKL